MLGQHQRAHALADLVDVDVGDDVRPAVRRQQPVDQQLQAVGLGDDDLRVLGQLALVFELHAQQLRRAADAAERVLDLVRQVAHQLLVGLGLALRALLAVLARLLLDLDHLDQHAFRVVGLGHDHVHRQKFRVATAGPAKLRVEAAAGDAVGGHGGERLAQRLRLDQPVGQRSGQQRAPGHAEQILEAGVGMQAQPVGRTTATIVASRSKAASGSVAAAVVRGVSDIEGSYSLGGGSLASSRLRAATSLCLRAMAAFISATRSRYFW